MQLRELLINVNIIEQCAESDMEITGVGNSTATLRQGELFVAIKGYKTDGHAFIGEALKKGASCVVCQEKPDVSIPYILVDDCRKAQAQIYSAWFKNPSEKLKIIGITGTNGKTTISYLIKHIIETCSNDKAGLIGTIENLVGDRVLMSKLTTPDSYELQHILDKMVFEGCRYVVMEVSSHALFLHRVHGINFEIGIFSNLTPDHFDFHSSMDEYAGTKAMLFENCKNSIINIDDAYAERMINNSKGNIVRYAVNNKDAQITAGNIKLHPGKTEFEINDNGQIKQAAVFIPGTFSVYNALAAVAAGKLLGYKTDDIIKALQSCPGVKGRAEVLQTNKDYTVIIDYAHTPDALDNIISTARSVTKGRVHTLFGCGGDRDKSKRPVMGEIASRLSDYVIVTTDNPRTESPETIIDEIITGIDNAQDFIKQKRLTICPDRREAIGRALDNLSGDDVLIIAGKGHETYQIIGEEKTNFDDREVVLEHLRKTGNNYGS